MSGGRQPAPEFSRIVDVSSIGDRPVVHEISATPAERAALVGRFGLHGLGELTASLTLRRRAGRLIELQGAFRAELEQVCVVTLDPVPASISGSFRQTYSPDLAQEAAGEVVVSLDDEEDDFEPLVGDRIDIGEAVAQQLAVSLDPYPRRPDATLPSAYSQGEADTAQEGAFAKLASLRRS